MSADSSGIDRILGLYMSLKKGVTLGKILRNAAKDAIQAAARATPVATRGKSTFWKLPEGRKKGGAIGPVIVNMSRLHWRQGKTAKHRRGGKRSWSTEYIKTNLKARFRHIRILKGWSAASWIELFRDSRLHWAGGTPPPKRNAPSAIATMHLSGFRQVLGIGGKRQGIQIYDAIRFDKRSEAPAKIIQAGLQLAADRLCRDVKKTIKEALKKK